MTRIPVPKSAPAPSDATSPLPPGTRLRLRLHLGSDLMLGPGKADLMEGIRATGSIAAAGRGMGMSYKRAWMLVEELNAAFHLPLVASARGGAGGGGAHLTELGDEVLERYRQVEAAAALAAAPHLAALLALRPPADAAPTPPAAEPSDMSDGK